MIVFFILLGILLLFAAVLLVRAAMFKPKKETAPQAEEVDFDHDRAVYTLGELVKCKTVSYRDKAREDNAEFEKLIARLPTLYPAVFSVCSLTRLEDRGLLFLWQGKDAFFFHQLRMYLLPYSL